MSEMTSTDELATDEANAEPTEQATEQPSDSRAGQPAEQSLEQPVEQPVEQSEEEAPVTAATAAVGSPEAGAATEDGRGSHTPTPSSDAGDEPGDDALMDAGDGGDAAEPSEAAPEDSATQPATEAAESGPESDPEWGTDSGFESGVDGSVPTRGTRVRQLEREGEVAADFLETLLDIADLDGDLDVDVDGDRAAVAIVDSDEGRVPRRLVGQDGKVLEALQELTRLAVQAETGERSRLMLDIAGHRAERRTALVELAKVAISEVTGSGEKKALDPMSAFERKVVHDEVAAAGLSSESEGTDPRRHVVILPA